LNGRDITDGLKLTSGQDVTGLEVEVTNKIPEVSGIVTDSRGEPVHEYAAIIFPQDQQLWTRPSERRTGMVRADQDGRFTFRTLRPGNYYVAAVETIEPGQWMDPDYLAAIRASAERVSVLEGETKTVALKLLTIQ
jgi:hypothetical protein